jgi:AcrR family transcriptional regulator
MKDVEPSGAPGAREKILQTAHDLFYRDGVRATGVDTLIRASGVAKATFYRHFPTKNDLVRAFLEHRHRRWIGWFEGSLAQHRARQNPAEREKSPLAPLSAALAEWLRDPAYRGCAFINSVAEIGGALPEARTISARHKAEMIGAIASLLEGAADAADIALAVGLAVDGAIVKAQLGGEEVDKALRALDCALAALAPAGDGATAQRAAAEARRHSASE